MVQAFALISARPLPQLDTLLRPVVVIGCALALIFAGPAFPSVL